MLQLSNMFREKLWCFTTSLCWGITKSGIDLVHVFQTLLMMKWFPFPKILGDACILAEAADPDEPAQREPGDACGKLHWLHGGEGTPQTPLFSILPCSLIPRNCTKIEMGLVALPCNTVHIIKCMLYICVVLNPDRLCWLELQLVLIVDWEVCLNDLLM